MVNPNVKSSEQEKTSVGWPKLRIIQHLWKIAHSGFSRLPGCFQLPVYDCTAVAVTCGGLLPFSLGGEAVLLEPVRGRGNWFERAGRLGSRSNCPAVTPSDIYRAHPVISHKIFQRRNNVHVPVLHLSVTLSRLHNKCVWPILPVLSAF